MTNYRKGINQEEIRQLLLLVMNVLADKWDEIEEHDPDQSTEKWKSYKGIRNTIRDVVKEIAKSKGVDL